MRVRVRRCAVAPCAWLFVALLLQGVWPLWASNALTDYRLDCMGCHLADGSGAPGKVPDMRRTLAVFASTPAGRRYLIEVPGVAEAPLSDAQIAMLLNWMIRQLSVPMTRGRLMPFTNTEVALYRDTPLVRVNRVRRGLLATSSRKR